jgi:hypothetical protein
MDISAPGVLEGYYPLRELGRFVYRYALREVPEAQANLIVHGFEHLPFARRVMPPAVVAMDLVESDDDRAKRAGLQFLRSQHR